MMDKPSGCLKFAEIFLTVGRHALQQRARRPSFGDVAAAPQVCMSLRFASTFPHSNRITPVFSQPDSAKALSIATGYFDREDDRFVAALRDVYYPAVLEPFVERWKRDVRSWARAQIFEYLRLPLDVPGHQLVVKRLYKQAEASRDHELVGAFMAAFDRLIRRSRGRRWTQVQDPVTRRWRSQEHEALVAEPNSYSPFAYFDQKKHKFAQYNWFRPYLNKSLRLFSVSTRKYLSRRVWRYFRRLAATRPTEYVAAIAPALLRYEDRDLREPENLLDSRSLMQICFGKHPALDFSKPYVALQPNRTLAELTAAPLAEDLWSTSSSGPVLLTLLLEAKSRTVRVWAKQLLERHHRNVTDTMSIETLFRMLDSPDSDLQQFGATLLDTAPGVDAWPLDTWLRLLELPDPTALAIVCEIFSKRVAASRLDAAGTVKLAKARAVPVARMGFAYLKQRNWNAPADRRALVELGGARCDAVSGELAKWALGIAGSGERYDRDVVVGLFDSLSEPMREAASSWFTRNEAAQDDPVLWTRLIETPYEEIRLRLVELLQYRASRPRVEHDDLSWLWSSVLLGVHRGGRHKLKAIEQLVAAIIDHPERGEELVPVLGVAVRSIRGPERRAGLAGVARLVDLCPGAVEYLRRELPELSFDVTTASGAT